MSVDSRAGELALINLSIYKTIAKQKPYIARCHGLDGKLRNCGTHVVALLVAITTTHHQK
jgi:hypothetical protein